MQIYFDVVYNIFGWALSQSAIYYPLLLVIAFCVLASIAFLIRYICRS